MNASTFVPPTSAQIGELYDRMTPFYSTVWDGDIHSGVWTSPDDPSSIGEAQARLTDMAIERMAVGPGSHALDVGSGVGNPALQLARATGCRVTGITVSQVQLEEARARAAAAGLADRVRFVLMDAMQLDFAEPFDAAWSIESILHVPDRDRVMSEMARVMRPGARLVLGEVTNEVPLTDEEAALFYPALGVASLLAARDFPAHLARNGFTVTDMLDLSREIENTPAHTMDRVRERRARLLEHYDEAFVDTLLQAWVTITGIHRSKMGYALITARRDA